MDKLRCFRVATQRLLDKKARSQRVGFPFPSVGGWDLVTWNLHDRKKSHLLSDTVLQSKKPVS